MAEKLPIGKLQIAPSSREVSVTIKDAARPDSSVTIRTSLESTIESVKKQYAAAMGQSKQWNGYKFQYGTAALTDSTKMSSVRGSTLGIIFKATYQEPPFNVNVRGLDGRTKKISAYESWTVRRLKEEYATWLGQGWDNVIMLYKAKRLRDTDLLSVYKIEPEGFIQANVRSLGGSDTEE